MFTAFGKIKKTVLKNRKVAENYFFMTILSTLNSFFYLLVYPFAIRKVGAEAYGVYVFSFAFVSYFITFVSFGFDMPAVKSIALNKYDIIEKSKTLSGVFTAKVYLLIISIAIISILMLSIDALRIKSLIIALSFLQIFSNILFPQWYFQGVQKMKMVTYIQVLSRFVSLPFIFLLIKGPEDLWILVLIFSLSSLLGALIALFIIKFKEGISIKWIKDFNVVKKWYKKGMPFFWSTAFAAIKQQSIPLIIAFYFTMADVAYYDLAYKVILIPTILFSSVNGALFPKLISDLKQSTVKLLFKYEFIAGFVAIVLIFVFGKPVVNMLGGSEMSKAYILACIMSFGILTPLLVTAFINFIFLPANRNYLVTKSQIFSFTVFFVVLFVGLQFYPSIIVVVLAWSISGVSEILMSYRYSVKYKLI